MDKAIARGTGELPGVVYEAATFEGYALGGVAVLVESLTDTVISPSSTEKDTLSLFRMLDLFSW